MLGCAPEPLNQRSPGFVPVVAAALEHWEGGLGPGGYLAGSRVSTSRGAQMKNSPPHPDDVSPEAQAFGAPPGDVEAGVVSCCRSAPGEAASERNFWNT